ncbi:osteopetrosis-associated transmembrane protein 1 [Microcaecilia unicolor]|uniref:Osteopetrosis-associated transmembrane protein 1 n=1 Tax=Microcaecilia unicolor TaxID=1415580 RepID=A0A6P7X2X5_9AMPH|nr:osteopetrosis-associated transmembrane protein 1 [Microcaecilia unicolor]
MTRGGARVPEAADSVCDDDDRKAAEAVMAAAAVAALGLALLLVVPGASSDWTELPDLDPACQLVLGEVANSSAGLSQCLVRFARPVRLCLGCRAQFQELSRLLSNVSAAPQNTSESSCAANLLRSDRLQLILSLTEFFNKTWKDAKCEQCFQKDGGEILNSTIAFLDLFDALIVCFEHNLQGQTIIPSQPGNYSQVCRNCSDTYRSLNALYGQLETGSTLCIDLEDAINITRRLWSTTFLCTVPCKDTVPVIAVSAFVLFLPVVFYLSSFLHSEQKKRKLIQPKRVASSPSLVNIQNKCS